MKIPFVEHHLLQLLKRFDQQWLPLDLFLSTYFRAHRALGSKDRKKIGEDCFGMIRWKLLLDHLGGEECGWERRYSIFKGIQPASFFTVTSIPLHVRLSCPKALFDHLVHDFGEKRAIDLATLMNTQAPITIRINPLKTTREALFHALFPSHELNMCEKSQLGLLFKERKPFFVMKEFKEGLFEVQDEASQLVSLEVKAKKGDLVLDYCAGAGGKSLGFAHLLQGRGQIFLHDPRASTLEQAKKRMKRAGIQNVQYFNEKASLAHLKGKMDWVIVDVPCSGSGTYRRNPDQKWKFSDQMLIELVQKQREIFDEAFFFAKSGGKILYSTCSLLKKENDEQVEYFLKQYGLTLDKPPFRSEMKLGGMDGFFAATFRKL